MAQLHLVIFTVYRYNRKNIPTPILFFTRSPKGGKALKALLVLEDGFSLTGETFSGKGEVYGEVVFNTSMTGYQEMVTDPSYRGQILTLTHPLIGNYGVNEYDVESAGPQVEGLLVRECCHRPHNRRARESLHTYLDRHRILGLEGIDTRSLTLHLRRAGTMTGAISTVERNPAALQRRVLDFQGFKSRDLVSEVSNPHIYSWIRRTHDVSCPAGSLQHGKCGYHVVVYDFGVKYNILRHLAARGCRVTVVPHRTTAAEVTAIKPDGVLLSNGPGDPVDQSDVIPEIKALLGQVPVFGICLGHQLLGMALGFSTFKLAFGHRGGNHPVRELSTGKVWITSQNHGYCVELESAKQGTMPTHINLNDGTLEGLENQSMKCFSVQYHPEASPGPHDSTYLFDRFIELIDKTEKWENSEGA